MEGVRTFLESSTIHGLTYISTTRRFVRVLWSLIVAAGFTFAGIIIYQSFADWEETPITSTIKTLPITQVTFPQVTVCPPKNTYTNLNYDIMTTANMTINEDTRKKLVYKLAEKVIDVEAKYLRKLFFGEKNKIENLYSGKSTLSVPINQEEYDRRCEVSLISSTIFFAFVNIYFCAIFCISPILAITENIYFCR